MVGGQELKISVPGVLPWYGWQNEGRHCYATKEHPVMIFLYAFFTCKFQLLSHPLPKEISHSLLLFLGSYG
jgi:hypothetical protein